MALAESVIELVNRQGATEGRVWLLKVLHELDDLECVPFVPPAQDLRYINVRPPMGCGRHRLCSIHVRSASVEFQANTFPLADSLNLRQFRLVPKGDKAAITPRSAHDVELVRALAVAEIARRRATS